MTIEEYYDKLAVLNQEMMKIQAQERNKREEIRSFKIEFCKSLCEKYAEYIDKKVKIRFIYRNHWSHMAETTDIVGYLRGFELGLSYSSGEIYPSVSKVKKDGGESKNRYSSGDVYPFFCIDSIEIV